MRKKTITTLLISICLAVVGCGGILDREWEEIARIENPKVEVDAVIYRTNAGAMSSYEYHVFAVPRSKGRVDGVEMLYASFIEPKDVAWIDNETIQVKSGGVKHITRLRFMDYVEVQKRVRLAIQDMPAI